MTVTLPWPFPTLYSGEEESPARAESTLNQSLSSFIHHYATPGKPPPSARIHASLKPQARPPIRLWDVWKYGRVAASKAVEVTSDILAHHMWGPRKKSWGIEMTIISSLMRGAGRHSALVDIGTIRMLMGLGGLVPLPSDALVTPVTFRVRSRQLRGIIKDLDAAETGKRELSGEWVVGKKTWQRLQAEWKATQAETRSSPQNGDNACPTPNKRKTHRVVLYIHGGAYYVSSAAAQRLLTIPLAKYMDARVFALDYRLAPETKFPGPLHDVVCGYFRLIEDLHIPPENIIISGDSAGGGLALALLMYLRDNDYPLPSGAILLSPWVDLTMSCESWDSNAAYDVTPIPAPEDHLNPVALYLGENMEQYLTHPYASPLFGDFKGLPPLLIQAGEAEVLRDEITLLAHKASLAGVEVRHELYEDAVHVFQLYPFLTACSQSFMSMREFVRNILPQLQSRSPQLLDEAVLEPEIDNEAASVVRGDGVKIATGKEEVEEELEDSEVTEISDSDDERTLRKYPSWGHASSWSRWSIAREEDDEHDDTDDTDTEPISHSHTPIRSRSRAGSIPSSVTGFRRIQSAISLIMAPETSSIPSRKHHRTASQVHSRTSTPNLSRRPSVYDMHKPEPIQIPPVNLNNLRSVPPSPSIRRSSNASHPDLSYLVHTWTNSGPANQTVVYPPSES